MQLNLSSKHHLLGGTLLIAGISFGVGMLALPVVTAASGFFSGVIIFILAWLFMVSSGLLILESCMWCPKDANLITISRTLLGNKGAACTWLLYLFLFYCLMVAHTAAGGSAVDQMQTGEWPMWASTLIYVAVFSPAVYLGTLAVDRLNKVLMFGLLATFFLFIVSSFSHVNLNMLSHSDPSVAWLTLPVVFTAFGYQNLIPTLVTYMDRDYKKVKQAIWVGTSIPLIVYLLWEFLILGIVPLDRLNVALTKGQNAVIPLQQTLAKGFLGTIGEVFAFFVMTTSFIGIAIAFMDFWADGLKWKKRGMHKAIVFGLVFLIPMIIVFIDPTVFFFALEWAGGIGVAILLGIFPVLFVWSGRYIHKHSRAYQLLKGGKMTLSLMIVFALLVISIILVK